MLLFCNKYVIVNFMLQRDLDALKTNGVARDELVQSGFELATNAVSTTARAITHLSTLLEHVELEADDPLRVELIRLASRLVSHGNHLLETVGLIEHEYVGDDQLVGATDHETIVAEPSQDSEATEDTTELSSNISSDLSEHDALEPNTYQDREDTHTDTATTIDDEEPVRDEYDLLSLLSDEVALDAVVVKFIDKYMDSTRQFPGDKLEMLRSIISHEKDTFRRGDIFDTDEFVTKHESTPGAIQQSFSTITRTLRAKGYLEPLAEGTTRTEFHTKSGRFKHLILDLATDITGKQVYLDVERTFGNTEQLPESTEAPLQPSSEDETQLLHGFTHEELSLLEPENEYFIRKDFIKIVVLNRISSYGIGAKIGPKDVKDAPEFQPFIDDPRYSVKSWIKAALDSLLADGVVGHNGMNNAGSRFIITEKTKDVASELFAKNGSTDSEKVGVNITVTGTETLSSGLVVSTPVLDTDGAGRINGTKPQVDLDEQKQRLRRAESFSKNLEQWIMEEFFSGQQQTARLSEIATAAEQVLADYSHVTRGQMKEAVRNIIQSGGLHKAGTESGQLLVSPVEVKIEKNKAKSKRNSDNTSKKFTIEEKHAPIIGEIFNLVDSSTHPHEGIKILEVLSMIKARMSLSDKEARDFMNAVIRNSNGVLKTENRRASRAPHSSKMTVPHLVWSQPSFRQVWNNSSSAQELLRSVVSGTEFSTEAK